MNIYIPNIGNFFSFRFWICRLLFLVRYFFLTNIKKKEREMEETTNLREREPWPTHLFDCCSGGASLCLWGFLCPLCLQHQGWSYSRDLDDPFFTTRRFERYPPWSCHGIDRSQLVGFLFFSYCCCLYGLQVAGDRQWKNYSPHVTFEYYCSSHPCCCCDRFAIEECLIGYFCCCCSIIQVTMAADEHFGMKPKVEGDLNIKRAH